MTAFSLSTVTGFQRKSCVAFSADFLVAVKLFGDGGDGGVHDSSSESQD